MPRYGPRCGALLTAFLILLALPLHAQTRPVLVELYTSQGCSSCPPADALLRKLAGRDDVIALALHVDYWDYIGWKDTFASPRFTARQRGYAGAAGRNMVYTPQMIVMGADHVVGNRPVDVTDLIEKHAQAGSKIDLSVRREGGRIHVAARAAPGKTGRAAVQLVRYRPSATVDIKRGENAGRRLDYTNVVTELRSVADWDMQAPLELDLPLEGDLPAVVMIQRPGFGPVEAVAQVE